MLSEGRLNPCKASISSLPPVSDPYQCPPQPTLGCLGNDDDGCNGLMVGGGAEDNGGTGARVMVSYISRGAP